MKRGVLLGDGLGDTHAALLDVGNDISNIVQRVLIDEGLDLGGIEQGVVAVEEFPAHGIGDVVPADLGFVKALGQGVLLAVSNGAKGGVVGFVDRNAVAGQVISRLKARQIVEKTQGGLPIFGRGIDAGAKSGNDGGCATVSGGHGGDHRGFPRPHNGVIREADAVDPKGRSTVIEQNISGKERAEIVLILTFHDIGRVPARVDHGVHGLVGLHERREGRSGEVHLVPTLVDGIEARLQIHTCRQDRGAEHDAVVVPERGGKVREGGIVLHTRGIQVLLDTKQKGDIVVKRQRPALTVPHEGVGDGFVLGEIQVAPGRVEGVQIGKGVGFEQAHGVAGQLLKADEQKVRAFAAEQVGGKHIGVVHGRLIKGSDLHGHVAVLGHKPIGQRL